MSHEAQEANANLTEIARLHAELECAEIARKAWTERGALAEANNLALRQAIWSAHFDIHYRHKDNWTWEECPKPTCYPLHEALASDHPGAALLTELEMARAVVQALRGIQVNWPPLTKALAAYDAATKVSDK